MLNNWLAWKQHERRVIVQLNQNMNCANSTWTEVVPVCNIFRLSYEVQLRKLRIEIYSPVMGSYMKSIFAAFNFFYYAVSNLLKNSSFFLFAFDCFHCSTLRVRQGFCSSTNHRIIIVLIFEQKIAFHFLKIFLKRHFMRDFPTR